MTDIHSTANEGSLQETNFIQESSTNAASVTSSENIAINVSMESEKTAEGEETVPCSPGSQNNAGKIRPDKYTEEEKIKRREFFKQQKEKKKAIFQRNRLALSRKPRSKINNKTVKISCNMTDEDTKMLEFYQVKLSVLKQENQELHKRLAYLVEENMRYLQKGPPAQDPYTL